MSTQPAGVTRRTVVKGAAWSVPVMAASVAVPAHAASAVNWNSKIVQFCSGNFTKSDLEGVVPSNLVDFVANGLWTLNNLDPDARRGFTITATRGSIPAGTQYILEDTNNLLDQTRIEAAVDASFFRAASSGSNWVLTVVAPIPEGTSTVVDLYKAMHDIQDRASRFYFYMVGNDYSISDNRGWVSTYQTETVELRDMFLPGINKGTITTQQCNSWPS